MKVNSRKALSRLSLRSLLASKKQNLITIFAIILTTVLFTALFTTFISLNNTLKLQQMKEYGDSSYAVMAIGDEEHFEALRDKFEVSSAGLSIDLGHTKDKTVVTYCDEIASEFRFSVPVEGHLPQSSDEAVMSKAELIKLGSDASVGDKVTVEYVVSSSKGEFLFSDTFTLSGISSDDSRYILVSEDYARDVISDLSDNAGMYMNSHFDLRTGLSYRAYDIAEDLGLNSRSVIVNPAFDTGSDPLGAEGKAALVVLMLLIFFTGFLIIYNIFQITVANKVRDYGLLKTIGVTSKQIRKIIRKQSAFLCPWMTTCLAVWAAMRPNFWTSTGMRMASPTWALGTIFRAASMCISRAVSSTSSTAVFTRCMERPFSLRSTTTFSAGTSR